MPGYDPFLLCDFHVYTTWSDGRLPVREVVDLYGQTGKFDVIAVTDHILMTKDLLALRGRQNWRIIGLDVEGVPRRCRRKRGHRAHVVPKRIVVGSVRQGR